MAGNSSEDLALGNGFRTARNAAIIVTSTLFLGGTGFVRGRHFAKTSLTSRRFYDLMTPLNSLPGSLGGVRVHEDCRVT